ncbi:MAG: retropepsin-like aspartic protease [Leptospiraceae bacterium]|nr:retropepsin-like aspartic protease [Leptospiraceae bacterium]
MINRFLIFLLFLNCIFSKKTILDKFYLHSLAIEDSFPVVELFVGPSDPNLAPKVKLKLIIDTGSNLSFVRKDLLPSLGMKQSIESKIISGATKMEVEVVSLGLEDSGRKRIINSNFYLFNYKKNFPYDGVVGNDILSNFKLYLDFPDYIHFSKKLDIDKKYQMFELNQNIDSHLVLPVTINNKRFEFILDTGAGVSFLNEDSILKDDLKHLSTREYYTFTGEVKTGKTYLADSICMNMTLCTQNVEIMSGVSLGDFFGRENIQINGLLGVNLLKNYKIWIDYSEKKIYVRKP